MDFAGIRRLIDEMMIITAMVSLSGAVATPIQHTKQVKMNDSLLLLSILWIIAVLLLLSSLVSKNRNVGLWGDVMLAVSFGVSSGMLIHERSYWIGAAFAFPAMRQAYVLFK